MPYHVVPRISNSLRGGSLHAQLWCCRRLVFVSWGLVKISEIQCFSWSLLICSRQLENSKFAKLFFCDWMQSNSWCLPHFPVVCEGLPSPECLRTGVSPCQEHMPGNRAWWRKEMKDVMQHKSWGYRQNTAWQGQFVQAHTHAAGEDRRGLLCWDLKRLQTNIADVAHKWISIPHPSPGAEGGFRFFPNLLLRSHQKDTCSFRKGKHLQWHRQTEEENLRLSNPNSIRQCTEWKTGGCLVLCKYPTEFYPIALHSSGSVWDTEIYPQGKFILSPAIAGKVLQAGAWLLPTWGQHWLL